MYTSTLPSLTLLSTLQGAEAGIFFIMANLDPSKGYKGITCFVADSSMKGIHVGKVS